MHYLQFTFLLIYFKYTVFMEFPCQWFGHIFCLNDLDNNFLIVNACNCYLLLEICRTFVVSGLSEREKKTKMKKQLDHYIARIAKQTMQ